jgi:hypothetical protein
VPERKGLIVGREAPGKSDRRPPRPKGRTVQRRKRYRYYIESLRFGRVAVIDRKTDATVGVFSGEKAALKAEHLAIRLNRLNRLNRLPRNSD